MTDRSKKKAAPEPSHTSPAGKQVKRPKVKLVPSERRRRILAARAHLSECGERLHAAEKELRRLRRSGGTEKEQIQIDDSPEMFIAQVNVNAARAARDLARVDLDNARAVPVPVQAKKPPRQYVPRPIEDLMEVSA